MTYSKKIILLLAICILSLLAVSQIAPIAQDPAYHNFADKRAMHGINNFWNVASSIPFLLFGLFGLYSTSKNIANDRLKRLQRAYTLFFTAAIFICFGSSYYHFNPSTDTLFWDRIPMTIAVMAFFSIVISEYVAENVGKTLLLPLVAVGIGTVFYWFSTEQSGAGDLRPYALVQFLPMLLIPVILILFRSANRPSKYLWMMLVVYGLSKAFEHFDIMIFDYLGEMSGHSIKHIAASLSILCFHMHFISRLKTDDE